jgi:hypothetical protein
MTATVSTPTVPVPAATAPAAPAEQRLGFRRAVQVALPAVTGGLLVAAVLTDPGAGNEGREMVRVYADHVDQLQWHATLLHFAYGAWGLVPLALAPLVRGRGRRIMNVAAALGFLVMVGMPGLMMSDLFLAAVSNQHGLDAAMKLYDEMPSEQWAIKAYLLPGLAGMFLALPVAFAALARARRTTWWAVLPAALVLPSFIIGAAGPAVFVTAALLAGLSVFAYRATR